ncbi:hypothetical protein INT48_003946 [Thamnidium elegans]|uniref:Peptidyl-prolyl isomerase CWC27 n=1 Tax=Thamnidium elegans TaxID=101142 RepID=A0A8H7SUJ8_9FUNG|nr:hypothetical protein INT48_003946 [Thamnidium elegans]
MSNIYALEPHTNGKVILHTTSGDIEIELWGKEAPRATRNFIQLCLEGYYDNTIFHRVVPDFLVQGGDPTGTGQGGESIYDQGFPDEFHSRLRFNRRGLVGLANTGQDDNGSQFFITLDRADDLTKKHTLFGRVAGDTLFNVMKMTELELDENERPLYPPRIKTAEVVLNPFDDIIPRITAEEKRVAKLMDQKKLEAEQLKQKRKGAKKRLNLLSFGEEAEEFEPPTSEKKKMKSTYDFMENAVPPPKELIEELKHVDQKQETKVENVISIQEKLKEKVRAAEERRKQAKEEEAKAREEEAKAKPIETPAEQRLNTIEKLKQDIRDISKITEDPVVEKKEKKKSLVELEREKYMSNKNKKKKKSNEKVDDSDAFEKLMAFTSKLSKAKPESNSSEKKEAKICKLHDIPNCESCFDVTDIEVDDTDDGWISHKLVFDKDLKGKDLMQRRETVDDYVVIDPRDREAKAKQEEFEKKRHLKSKVGHAFRREDDRKHHDNKRRDDRRDDYSDMKKELILHY